MKPCPFCGWLEPELSKKTVRRGSDGSRTPVRYATRCGNCGARGPIVRVGGQTAESARMHARQLWDDRIGETE